MRFFPPTPRKPTPDLEMTPPPEAPGESRRNGVNGRRKGLKSHRQNGHHMQVATGKDQSRSVSEDSSDRSGRGRSQDRRSKAESPRSATTQPTPRSKKANQSPRSAAIYGQPFKSPRSDARESRGRSRTKLRVSRKGRARSRNARREPLLVDTRNDDGERYYGRSSPRCSLGDDDRDVPTYQPPDIHDQDSIDGAMGNDRYMAADSDNPCPSEEDSITAVRAEMEASMSESIAQTSMAGHVGSDHYAEFSPSTYRRPFLERISSNGGHVAQTTFVRQPAGDSSIQSSVFARHPPARGDTSVQMSVFARQPAGDDAPPGDTSMKNSVFARQPGAKTDYYGPNNSAFGKQPVISEVSTNSYMTQDEGAHLNGRDEEEGDDTTTTNITPRKELSEAETFSGRFGLTSGSEGHNMASLSEDGVFLVKQRVAYLCIVLTSIQLGILIIQLTLCGMASLRINPMVGPYPDAFSEWGGKNAYLLVRNNQYFRLITPVLLHVGILHLLVNAYCQLETCAYLEREWGSIQWILIYLVSGVGSCLAASTADPDTIGVLSSGALMGMFGAKIAQVITWSIFRLKNNILEESVHFEQLGGVMCSAATVSLLSFFTYIDWSGHLGGLGAGFLAGMVLFSSAIKSIISKLIWWTIAMAGLIIGTIMLLQALFFKTSPDEDLGNACEYFRNLYPEGYECECVWD